MSSLDVTAVAVRLAEGSDQERFELLQQMSREEALRSRFIEACLLLSVALANKEPSSTDPADPDELAIDLARGGVPLSALLDTETVRWLLDSLADTAPSGQAGPETASEATRRKMRAVVTPTPTRSVRWSIHLPALVASAAVIVMAVLLLRPASEPWAQTLDLSVWRTARLSNEFKSDLRASLEGGRASEPVFELTSRSRRERALLASGIALPEPKFPRWEVVAGLRPEFRFGGSADDGEFEVLLVDEENTLLWRVEFSGKQQLDYPTQQNELRPDATYYWKVNQLGGERIIASGWIGFRTLSSEGKRALNKDLGTAAQHPYLKGSAYERHGLYTPAAAEYAIATEQAALEEVAARAHTAVLAKQGYAE